MRREIRKIVGTVLIVLLLTAITIPKVRNIYENSHIKFADETMGEVIGGSIRGGKVKLESITRKDLKEIKRLRVGFCSYYKTLKDIQYCTEIENLAINWRPASEEPTFAINQGKADRELTKEEVEAVQRELEKILPRLFNLRVLWLSNWGGGNWTSVEFLRNCAQIEELYLYNGYAKSYSALQTCTS